jgi:hypothetical protein
MKREKQWESDNPGAGAGSVSVCAFKDLFFVDDEVSNGADTRSYW